ncbi:MAG: hypothetical protein MI974_21575 [Chitinophagales bacterium]|nr:hypothetical protein [Chitinophagales bacterium]
MKILLDIKHPNDLWALMEFIRSLPEIKVTLPDESTIDDIQSSKINPNNLSKDKALEVIQHGSEMLSFEDPVEYQRKQRKDRKLPKS